MACACLLCACSGTLIDPKIPQLPAREMAPELYQPPVEVEYRIQIGDKLTIRSYFDPQINQEAIVRRDGRISLLLLADAVVVGETPRELGKRLTEEYAKRVNSTDVTVAVVEAVDPAVYVGGEVAVSAQQKLTKPLTVVQAITSAGGFRPTANTKQVIVLRHQPDGQSLAYQIDVEKVLVNQARDIYLQPSDVVYVPLSRIANVDKFVSQYINQIIPDALRFTTGYTWLNTTSSSSTPVNFQVVQP